MQTIDDLFAYIHSLAKNFKTELFPRYFWQQANNKPLCKYVLVLEELIENQCGVTDIGLSGAICGNPFSAVKIANFDDIKKHKEQIQNNTDFFIYNFELGIGEMSKEYTYGTSTQSVEHKFKVIAYRNKNQEIRYHFLQSYVTKYTLSEFLNKVNSKEIRGEYSQEEFSQFILGLKDFLKAKNWNDIHEFYKTYFYVDLAHYRDHEFVELPELSVEFIKADLKTANSALKDFNQYKSSKHYPEFIFLSGEDNETCVLENSFGENKIKSELGDMCAFHHPWKGLLFEHTDAGSLLSPSDKYKNPSIKPNLENNSLTVSILTDRISEGLADDNKPYIFSEQPETPSEVVEKQTHSELQTAKLAQTKPKNIDILQQILTKLIGNIQHKSGTRESWFTSNTDSKVEKLTAISNWLSMQEALNANSHQTAVALIREVCNEKRNCLGLFQPHSLDEFNSMMKAKKQIIPDGISFTSQQLKCLNDGTVDRVIQSTISSFLPNKSYCVHVEITEEDIKNSKAAPFNPFYY
jgi:hypothetical protein